jgi:hypothetical protein
MSPFDNQTKLNLHERKNTTSVDQFNEFSLSISPTCPFSHPLFFLGHLEARASWTVVVRQESQHPVLSDCALAQVPTAPLQDCHFPDMPQQEAQDKSFGERGTKHLLSPVWGWRAWSYPCEACPPGLLPHPGPVEHGAIGAGEGVMWCVLPRACQSICKRLRPARPQSSFPVQKKLFFATTAVTVATIKTKNKAKGSHTSNHFHGNGISEPGICSALRSEQGRLEQCSKEGPTTTLGKTWGQCLSESGFEHGLLYLAVQLAFPGARRSTDPRVFLGNAAASPGGARAAASGWCWDVLGWCYRQRCTAGSVTKLRNSRTPASHRQNLHPSCWP